MPGCLGARGPGLGARACVRVACAPVLPPVPSSPYAPMPARQGSLIFYPAPPKRGRKEEFIFRAVHHATKFCLLTLAGLNKPQQAADFVFFTRQTEHLKEANRHFSLSAVDIALLNPNPRTCQIFRSKRNLELTKAIYQQVPVLMKEGAPDGNPWNVSLRAMFHMANDSHLFRTREQLTREGWKLIGNVFHKGAEQYLPLYEGKMIWHFDHCFGT